MNAAPIQNQAGAAELEALSAAFGSFIRVTEELRASYEKLRERAERIDLELSITNDRLNGVLAALPSGVVVSDVKGRITSWNAAAERILGLPAPQALGRPAPEIRDAEGRPLLLSGNPDATPAHGERERRTAGGRRAVLGGGLSPIRDGEGKGVGTVEIVEDLTELWDLRERLHRLDKLAALGEMSAVVAHEIRNPLNGVHGFADLIAKQLAETDPRLSGYARNILRGVREVDAIIGDLLAFAAPERLSPSPVELGRVLAQASEFARQGVEASQASRIRVRSELPPEGVRLAGDPVKLGQVFRNLFSNAIDAMPGGGEIRVAARVEGGAVKVSVEDEGPGIPAEAREKLFDPFFTTKTQGTGLGLAIVRKLVELHGGKVALGESARGARFEIEFPQDREGNRPELNSGLG